jgi:HK97 family phage major capsid protein
MRRATFFSKFRKGLVDAEGNPMVSMVAGAPGSPTFYIDGRPVMFSSKIAANAFAFYDLSDYVVDESQEIVIESDPSPKFQSDETVFKGKVYAGGTPCFPTTAGVYYTLAQ